MVGGPGTLPELALVAAAGDGKEEVVRALLEADRNSWAPGPESRGGLIGR